MSKRYFKIDVQKTVESDLYVAVDEDDPRLQDALRALDKAEDWISRRDAGIRLRAVLEDGLTEDDLYQWLEECAENLGSHDWTDEPGYGFGVPFEVPEQEAQQFRVDEPPPPSPAQRRAYAEAAGQRTLEEE